MLALTPKSDVSSREIHCVHKRPHKPTWRIIFRIRRIIHQFEAVQDSYIARRKTVLSNLLISPVNQQKAHVKGFVISTFFSTYFTITGVNKIAR